MATSFRMEMLGNLLSMFSGKIQIILLEIHPMMRYVFFIIPLYTDLLWRKMGIII